MTNPEPSPVESVTRGNWAGRWIPLAALLTLIMFVWLGWHAYTTFVSGSTIKSAYVRSEEMRDLVCDLENKLLLAAVLAVGSGEAEWRDRYQQLSAQLSVAIDAAVAAEAPGYNQEALEAARMAHVALRASEREAIDMAADGQRDAALALLSAAGYQAQAGNFASATKDFIESYRDYLDHRLRREGTKELASLGVTFVIFAASLTVWLLLAHRLERWRAALIAAVNERMRIEEKLLRSQKMEAVGQLASGVAHDFNNLLTAIRGFAFLARQGLPESHPSLNALDRLEEAANQAGGVTRSLLTFGRKAETEKRPHNLRVLLGEIDKLVRGMLPASIRLELHAPRDIWVRVDRTELVQALLNLAINAREAMPQGGSLSITVDSIAGETVDRAGETMARIRVRDTGTGMTEEVREKAFDPFFTTRPRGQGTGLGLAVVHGVVSSHDGLIQLESTPGEGTTVTLLLPTLAQPTESTVPVEAGGGAVTGIPATILVAEDQIYVREIISTALRAEGHSVIEAGSGPEFLSALRSAGATVRLAVIDVDLPGRDGIDCLLDLRSEGSKIPVIVITGLITADLEDRIGGSALLLRKPFAMEDLTRIVNRLLAEGLTP